jgi:hypothetical protein
MFLAEQVFSENLQGPKFFSFFPHNFLKSILPQRSIELFEIKVKSCILLSPYRSILREKKCDLFSGVFNYVEP